MMVTRRISLCNATEEEEQQEDEEKEREEEKEEEARPRYPVDGIQWAGAAYASLTISYGAS